MGVDRIGQWTANRFGVAAVIAVAAGVVGATGAGCYREGTWPAASVDMQTYISTEQRPWTITLVDTRSGESMWSVDVPVGEQIVVGFSKGTGPNEYKPDEIIWGLMPAGRKFGSRDNRLPCPPAAVRRLDAKIRESPEPVWSADPESPYSRPEPRPIERAGGRTVEPIEYPSADDPDTD